MAPAPARRSGCGVGAIIAVVLIVVLLMASAAIAFILFVAKADTDESKGGGSTKKESAVLTEDEYRDELSALMDEYSAAEEEVITAEEIIYTEVAEDGLDEDELAEANEGIDEGQKGMEAAAEAITDLVPPADWEEAHDTIVGYYEMEIYEFVELEEWWQESVFAGMSEDELGEIRDEFFSRFDDEIAESDRDELYDEYTAALETIGLITDDTESPEAE